MDARLCATHKFWRALATNIWSLHLRSRSEGEMILSHHETSNIDFQPNFITCPVTLPNFTVREKEFKARKPRTSSRNVKHETSVNYQLTII